MLMITPQAQNYCNINILVNICSFLFIKSWNKNTYVAVFPQIVCVHLKVSTFWSFASPVKGFPSVVVCGVISSQRPCNNEMYSVTAFSTDSGVLRTSASCCNNLDLVTWRSLKLNDYYTNYKDWIIIILIIRIEWLLY